MKIEIDLVKNGKKKLNKMNINMIFNNMKYKDLLVKVFILVKLKQMKLK